ncbi:MAG TPA: proline dehydrogenase family protein [Blastocatellia bacterium]|nr:proline dehydrogenase family protein [Blastocatellia bacterium]
MMKAALLYLSEREAPKKILTNNALFNKVTKRFVAGEELDEAARAIRVLNDKGITATFDHLGEAIRNETEASAEVGMYKRIIDRIESDKLDSNVSLKLTQLGLDISNELCVANLTAIVEHAAETGNFVRIDMEDSAHTDATLDVFRTVRATHENVGIVVQSYLYRTEDDIRSLLGIGSRIRLCKGAYKEPAEVAFQEKAKVDANYVVLMKLLLQSGIYHGIATHDPKMINATIRFAREAKIEQKSFEFQMLYGIARDRQVQLVEQGFNVRVYVPFGRAWYPYFMRRLAERPANVLFILRALVKG